jgi:hypothetical protein
MGPAAGAPQGSTTPSQNAPDATHPEMMPGKTTTLPNGEAMSQ